MTHAEVLLADDPLAHIRAMTADEKAAFNDFLDRIWEKADEAMDIQESKALLRESAFAPTGDASSPHECAVTLKRLSIARRLKESREKLTSSLDADTVNRLLMEQTALVRQLRELR